MSAESDGVHVPGSPSIPGLRFRYFRDERDWTALAELKTAANLADSVEWLPSADSVRLEYAHSDHIRLDRDLLLAELDGRLIAEADAETSLRDGRPVHYVWGVVHPDWRRRGLGRALLRWNEARAQAVADADPALGGPETELASWIPDEDVGAGILLRKEGYAPVRYSFTMVRRDLDDVTPVRLPSGLEIRPVDAQSHRAVYDADTEAFRDHPGFRERTDADFAAHLAEPELDTSLWRVAWDGDEVAGSVLAYVWREENATLGVRRGWLERISVRRPWRGRGVAGSLIADALIGLRSAGMDEAMLGVDAENPSGALALYASMGFVEKTRSTDYRKPLRG